MRDMSSNPQPGRAPLASVPGVPAEAPPDNSSTERLIRELTGEAKVLERTPEEWQAAAAEVVEKLLSESARHGVKDSPKLLLDEIILRAKAPGADVQRRALVRAVLARLANAKDLNERIFLLRELALVGAEESVPALASSLSHGDSAVRQYALRALEANPSKEAGRALLAALEGGGPPEWSVAVVNALGSRRSREAVPELKRKLDREGNADVASALRMALGNIGAEEAVAGKLWKEDRIPASSRAGAARARLLCAERLLQAGKRQAAGALYEEVYATTNAALLRMAALRGVVLASPERGASLLIGDLGKDDPRTCAQAARLVLDLEGSEALEALRKALPDLPPSTRALVEEALAERERA